MGETTKRVEDAAIRAMTERNAEPFLGGQPLHDRDDVPTDGLEIHASEIGYVAHIDTAALQRVTEKHEANVYVLALPGAFIDTKRPLAIVTGAGENLLDAVTDAFSIASERSFDQDPRFGLIVLSEIAQRALSSAVNDPGTAIDVIGRAVRALSIWGEPVAGKEPRCPRVHVPPVHVDELFDDFFLPVARDGAGVAEVQVRLQKALAPCRGWTTPGSGKAPANTPPSHWIAFATPQA